MLLRAALLFLLAAFVTACGGAANPTPTGAAPTPTAAPSSAPTSAPSLDPSLSDAGVVGRATISGDTRADRDGTYEVIGVDADGSSCGVSFEGDEFIANATNESAPEGQVRLIAVTIPSGDVPAGDGDNTAGVADGRVAIDFASSSFIGTLYAGEPVEDDRTSASIDVTRQGTMLVFEYQGTTWDSINFSGQLICENAD
jgi:hypothetical protein